MSTNSPKSKIVKVRVDSLLVHPTAQRELSPSHLKKLVDHMDLDSIGVLHAIETTIDARHGLYLIDGQHRYTALMHHGFGEWLVEVRVHIDANSAAKASEQFLKLNTRLSVNPYATFDNEVKAGYPHALAVIAAAEKLGLKVSRQSGDGKLACPSVLKKISKMGVLYETLVLSTTAHGSKASALEGRYLEGIAVLLKRTNGNLDKPTLVKKMQKYPAGASGILGDAKGRRNHEHTTLANCIARQLIDTYNQGRRSGRIEL